MRNNRALSKSAGSLIHPLTLAAIVVLLVNDHILRWMWPSWVWGKLGDFSWLIFFPFIPALILSLVVPKRWKNQEALVAGLSFALTGLVFSLMNTVPAAHAAGLRLIQMILNAPFILRLDPTDLLTLPGLLIGWHIWNQINPDRQFKTTQAYPVLVLGALASIATSAPPPDGVDCLYLQEDGTITATLSYYAYDFYESQDGGVTWQETKGDEIGEDTCIRKADNDDWIVTHPGNDQIQYHIVPGESVFISSDGGENWRLDIDLKLSQAQITYYAFTQGYGLFVPGPFDALVDENTGNLILAMGIEGILTQTSTGELLWFEEASYHYRADTNNPGYVISLLRIEFILAVVLFFMVGSIASLHIGPPKGLWLVMIVMTTLVWSGIAISSPAVKLDKSGIVFLIFLSPLWLLVVITLTVGFSALVARFKGKDGRIFSTLAPTSLLFILPYILWSQDIIHKYTTAMIIALILISFSAPIGIAYLVRIHKAASDRQDEDSLLTDEH